MCYRKPRALLPLVQIPPRGVWGKRGLATHTTAETWIGDPLAPSPDADSIALRYLAAYGPASVRDIQTWSGLTRLNEVVERLRADLVTFRDEQGVELFDVPNSPLPEPEAPAPLDFWRIMTMRSSGSPTGPESSIPGIATVWQ